jgi:hypothetical protein
MRKTTLSLDDEHMTLYEWSGAGAGTILDFPTEQTNRTRSRRVTCSVLALVGSLLTLSGCNTPSPAEQAVGETNMKAGSLYEEATTKPVSAASQEAVGDTMGETPAEQPAR